MTFSPAFDDLRVHGDLRRDVGPRCALDVARGRLAFLAAVFAFAFLATTARLADLTLLRDGAEPRLAVAAPLAPPPAVRADIVDRNGVVLATSLETASLYADPAQILDVEEAAAKLIQVLPELSYDEILRKLQGGGRFVWLSRNLTPRQQYAVNRLGVPGFAFEREERRVYPSGPLAAHLVGFASVDNVGLAGLEKSFDQRLKSSSEPLRTSIDVRIQHILRNELAAAVERFDAIGGSGVVMDVRTGEILAMVSLPDFDPNAPAASPQETWFNRNTLGVYEMGSTFKAFNTALVLDSGAARLFDSFDATKPLKVGRFTIRDFHGENRWLTVPEIFMHSSNIGSVKMVETVGLEAQKAFLGRLGLLAPATVELPEVGAPLVPNPWRDVNMMTISYGHGISVSPVQLVAAVGAMVNGGVMRNPTILARDPDEPIPGARVIREETSDAMRRLMRLVVTHGSATRAAAPGYLVGGKTGTAEKAKGRGYSADARLSSFVGAFPIDDPRYAVFVMLDEPKGIKETAGYATGGWVAAPVVSRVVSQMAPLVGLAPVDETNPAVARTVDLQLPGGRKLVSY